jgi:hypothetical protein
MQIEHNTTEDVQVAADQTGGQAPPSDTGASAPAQQTTQVEADAKLRAENASWRVKVRELEARVSELQGAASGAEDLSGQVEAQRERAKALREELRSTRLDTKLRDTLAQMGVTHRGRQDLIIKAKRSDLSVSYDDNNHPVGDFMESLRGTVELLGPSETAAPAKAASSTQKAQVPAVITAPRQGPLTYEERIESGHAALARVRGGEYVP